MQENRIKILFDMDGTLHPIREKSFIDSKVHEVMAGRSIEYVMNELGLGKDEASRIFNEIIENYPRFYSVGLQEKRGLDRWRYLDFAWNINPEGIVERVPGLPGMLEGLSTVGDLYVVSDAPRVWMNNVLKHLQIRDKFTEIYSGTNLNLKKK